MAWSRASMDRGLVQGVLVGARNRSGNRTCPFPATVLSLLECHLHQLAGHLRLHRYRLEGNGVADGGQLGLGSACWVTVKLRLSRARGARSVFAGPGVPRAGDHYGKGSKDRGRRKKTWKEETFQQTLLHPAKLGKQWDSQGKWVKLNVLSRTLRRRRIRGGFPEGSGIPRRRGRAECRRPFVRTSAVSTGTFPPPQGRSTA